MRLYSEIKELLPPTADHVQVARTFAGGMMKAEDIAREAGCLGCAKRIKMQRVALEREIQEEQTIGSRETRARIAAREPDMDPRGVAALAAIVDNPLTKQSKERKRIRDARFANVPHEGQLAFVLGRPRESRYKSRKNAEAWYRGYDAAAEDPACIEARNSVIAKNKTSRGGAGQS